MEWNEWDDLDEWEFLLGCLQENANAGLAEMRAADGLETSTTATTAATTGPTIVQGVK